jgi:hypothetical protein
LGRVEKAITYHQVVVIWGIKTNGNNRLELGHLTEKKEECNETVYLEYINGAVDLFR